MRIISRGKPPEEDEIKFSCMNCATIFVETRKNCQTSSDQNPGCIHKCPVCGHTCISTTVFNASEDVKNARRPWPYWG